MADFAEIKEKVSIEQAVEMLGLEVTRSGGQLRSPCPACGNGGHRALAITPSKGLAYCFSAGVGGDVIFLASHIDKCSLVEAGNRLADYFKIGQKQKPHVPQATEHKKTVAKPPAQFDPKAFAEKLEYSPEVEALGISEEDAQALGIGFYRGKLYQALRYDTGDIAGFAAVEGAKLPSKLLPQVHNVVAFQKRA
jgi:DNA primase